MWGCLEWREISLIPQGRVPRTPDRKSVLRRSPPLFNPRSGAAVSTVLCLLALACSSTPTQPDPDPDPPAVASVVVTPDSTSIEVGSTQTYAASTRDASGNTLSGRAITWTTADAAVATVSATGVVTGVGSGTTTVSATSEGVTGGATVVVVPIPVASVDVAPDSVSLNVSETVTLSATTLDGSGGALTGRTVTWTSTDVAVATVDGVSGLVTAASAGSTSVVATSEGVSDTAVVVVVDNSLPVGYTKVWRSDASDTDWSNAVNWLPAGEPTEADTVFILAGANQPLLGKADTIAGFGQEMGSAVDVGANTLMVSGDVLADGNGIVGSGTLELTGSGVLQGTVPRLSVVSSYALGGPTGVTGTLTVSDSGVLTVAGQALAVGGSMSIQSGGLLVMTDAADEVDIDGHVTFGGASTAGTMTAGTLRVAGNFTTLGSSVQSFQASGTHRTVLDGAAPQTVSFFFPGVTLDRSYFNDLELAGGDVTMASNMEVNGDLTMLNPTSLTGDEGLVAWGALTTPAGSDVSPTRVALGGDYTIAGTFSPQEAVFFGTGQLIPPTLDYQDVTVLGTVSLTAATSLTGTLTVSDSGVLTVAGQALAVGGSMSIQSGGLLVMTDAADEVDIDGHVTFGGASTAGTMTAGTLRVAGNFTTLGSSVQSFQASGTHRTVLDGAAPQTVSFFFPGVTLDRSYFNDLELAGGDVTMASNMEVNGDLTMLNPTSLTGDEGLVAWGALTTPAGSDVSPTRVALGGDYTIAGTFSPQEAVFFGTGQQIPPTLDYQDVTVLGTVSLTAATSLTGTLTVSDSGVLTVAGQALAVGGSMSIQSGGLLVMTDAADEVDIDGHVTFGGASTAGTMTAGTLRVAGNFTTLGSSVQSFQASGTHRTVLDGVAPQTVSFFFPGVTLDRSYFNDLELAGGDVTMASNMEVNGDLTMLNPTSLTGDAGLVAWGALTTPAGSDVSPTRVALGGDYTIAGTFSPQEAVFFGTGQLIPPTLDYQDVTVLGTVSLTGATSLTGTLTVSDGGALTVAGQALAVGGSMSTESGGLLVMTDAADEVDIDGHVTFGGASTAGTMTAGTLRVAGNFTTLGSSVQSFQASGTHRTVLDGVAPQTVSFFFPGVTLDRSYFNDLELAGGDVTISSGAASLGDVSLTGAMTMNATFTFEMAADLTLGLGSNLVNNGTINITGTCTDLGATVTGTGGGNNACIIP